VLGGDGSVSHAARGLIAARSATPLVIFAGGTGNDFAKSLGVPARDFLAMARRIEAGSVRVIDAGEIDGVPFVNSAGFGFDVDVLQRTRDPRRSKLLRGRPFTPRPHPAVVSLRWFRCDRARREH
jgi:diacylglycerol kinase (ATP)